MLRTTTRRSSTLLNSIWCKQKLQDNKSSVAPTAVLLFFSSKVICGECGSFYGQKIRHFNDPYRKVVWRCNRKFNGKYVCETPTLGADEIKEKFIIAYNQLLGNRKELFEAFELMCEGVGDCSALNAEIDKLNEEIEEVTETVNRFVKENASTRLSQESYDQKYNFLV